MAGNSELADQVQQRLAHATGHERLTLLAWFALELSEYGRAASSPRLMGALVTMPVAIQQLRAFHEMVGLVTDAMLDVQFDRPFDAARLVSSVLQLGREAACDPYVTSVFRRLLEGPTRRQRCPCCGYFTITGQRGIYDICPVCFWEDDQPALMYGEPAPHSIRGANHVTLEEARENFAAFGASEQRIRAYVRPPKANELPENNLP